jgi:hypothetical protein
MDWLEQNIDAYRIVSEILGQLRITIREGLEHAYGDEWYRKGFPEDVFERLVAAKEREKSIDWYEGQYQQIMDYATFPDLIEVLEKNADHFPEFVNLAPSRALLQARFLELDVMRAKLGRARPISETELQFLGTFHLRFRKAADEARLAATGKKAASPTVNQGEGSSTTAAAIGSEAENEAPGASEPAPAAEPEEPSRPLRPVQTGESPEIHSDAAPIEDDASAGGDIPTEELPPEVKIGSGESEPDADGGRKGDEADPGDETGPAPKSSGNSGVTAAPKKLRVALDTNDHQTILRELYREVTAIAEGVWSSDVTPAPMVWDQVTASNWYEVNFSRLGLHSLSVFYEVTSNVEMKRRGGADRKELEEFLKEMNFAKTLLSLRDMFQSNNI